MFGETRFFESEFFTSIVKLQVSRANFPVFRPDFPSEVSHRPGCPTTFPIVGYAGTYFPFCFVLFLRIQF